MIPCATFLSRLAGYVDAELPPEAAEEMRAHLQSCGACRIEEGRERSTRDALRRIGFPAAPSAVRDRIFAGIEEAERGLARWRGFWVPAAAAAGLFIAILVGALGSFVPPPVVAEAASLHAEIVSGRMSCCDCDCVMAVQQAVRGETGMEIPVPVWAGRVRKMSAVRCGMPCVAYRTDRGDLTFASMEVDRATLPDRARRDFAGRCVYVFVCGGCTVMVCVRGERACVWVSTLPPREMADLVLDAPVGPAGVEGLRLRVDMGCAACAEAARSIVAARPGVRAVAAYPSCGDLVVDAEEGFDLAGARAALAAAGFASR